MPLYCPIGTINQSFKNSSASFLLYKPLNQYPVLSSSSKIRLTLSLITYKWCLHVFLASMPPTYVLQIYKVSMQVAPKGRFGPSLELCVTKPTSRRIIKFGRDCILHQVYFVLCCIFRCIFWLATFFFALYFVFDCILCLTVFCV